MIVIGARVRVHVMHDVHDRVRVLRISIFSVRLCTRVCSYYCYCSYLYIYVYVRALLYCRTRCVRRFSVVLLRAYYMYAFAIC